VDSEKSFLTCVNRTDDGIFRRGGGRLRRYFEGLGEPAGRQKLALRDGHRGEADGGN
jgi:hypothetical protein